MEIDLIAVNLVMVLELAHRETVGRLTGCRFNDHAVLSGVGPADSIAGNCAFIRNFDRGRVADSDEISDIDRIAAIGNDMITYC